MGTASRRTPLRGCTGCGVLLKEETPRPSTISVVPTRKAKAFARISLMLRSGCPNPPKADTPRHGGSSSRWSRRPKNPVGPNQVGSVAPSPSFRIKPNTGGNAYTYDAWGNLLQKTVTKCGAEGLSVTADAHNWIHATGGSDYLYDAAGNLTFNATPPTQTYTYDQENRLTGAAGYAYTYDGDGNRVRKSNGNLAANGTLYWYMAPGVVAETDLAGTTQSEYVFFGGGRVARRDGATGTGGVFYYFSDHLKTASVITDSAGIIKAESDYYPWGGELQFVNNDLNHYKFTGKERDSESGLDYFGARYYSNGLGRWVSADWSATPVPVPYAEFIDPQSLNLYGYVRGIPTARFDQDGHADCGWWCRTKQRFRNSNVGLGFRTDDQVKSTAANFRNRITKDETLQVYFGDKGELRSYTRDQLDKMSDAQVIALVDEIGPDAPSNEATQEMAVALGAASQYNDITKGNSVKNIQTDVKRADFESNLSANGWNKSTSKDGLTTIYEKDGAKYVIRDNAKSTGTPTADFYKAGSNEVNIKIRMPQ